MTKNSTRIASLLGTWTGQSHIKADIGSYELMAYFTLHIMPDPMRTYSCTLDGCSEEKNQACMMEEEGIDNYRPTCKNLPDTVMDWGDVTAFMYFGARVDVGFPFNKHRGQDTGGWVGPINLIVAQREEAAEESYIDSNSSGERIVDRYVSRYVETPSTQFLHMPKNCTLLKEHDFQKLAGPEAVKSTVRGQYSDEDGNADDDPYSKYLKTCSNGEVKPMLPSMEFEFVQNEDDKDGAESINVKLNYKLLVVPKKTDYVYKLFPMIQNRMNKAGYGFTISGPYCYEEDPRRGYTFDLDFDSSDDSFFKLDHGCVEGLPCIPPAAELYVESQNSSIDVKPMPDNATTVGIGKYVFLGMVITVLFGIVICLFHNNRLLKRQLREVQEEEDTAGVDITRAQSQVPDSDRISIPYESMEDAHEVSVPSTSQSGEEIVEETHLAEQNREGHDNEHGEDDETRGLLSNQDATGEV